nr:MAG TPA: hypothetical protein [Caudoviricetes sp.]
MSIAFLRFLNLFFSISEELLLFHNLYANISI